MTVLTAFSLLLFPHININEDMTRYLPDDSRMKHGVDSLKTYFPEIDMNAYFVKAMFSDVRDKDSLARNLTGIDGVAGITSVKERDGLILYQLSVKDGADPKAIASGIGGTYGDSVVVEHNANSIMPENMGLILIVGVAIVFGILFLMCSSFVEALLFILTIGMAVILNIGTNALLPSVSMMTNTIVAVLQLVLSMDYSIILMNRFRQIKQDETDIDKAMSLALKAATPSILSSGFTTIVGLLALLFMKFKIGTDLGIVLAKGVFFSLISIYTILPALIILFYGGIIKTEKKVFLLPTDRLARFELGFRIPLSILFLVIFVLSLCLSRRTELSYASIWESRIGEVFPPENTFSLLYRTQYEDKMIDITDSMASNQNVIMTLSYPALFKKELTAAEMYDNIQSLISLLPNLPGAEIPDLSAGRSLLTPETLRILFYAATHPERDERMSFEDMIKLGEEAAMSGLMPEGMDVEQIVAKYMAPDGAAEPESEKETDPEKELEAISVPVSSVQPAIIPETHQEDIVQEVVPEEPASEELRGKSSLNLADIAKPTVDESGDDPYNLRGKYHFTKEGLNTPMSSNEIADYLGFSDSQASAAFSMAKKRRGKMTPDEFIDYMIDKVLGNKLLRKMISDKQAEGLYYIREEMDAVLNAPEIQDSPAPDESVIGQDISAANNGESEVNPAIPEIGSISVPVPDIPEPQYSVLPATVGQTDSSIPETTPLERLAEMFASGRKYSAKQIHNALRKAGIDILDEGSVNLMFTYYGSMHNYDDDTRMSLEKIIDFLTEEVASSEDYAAFLDEGTRAMLGGLREMVDDGMEMLRKDEWSMAAIVTGYSPESDDTFDFVENVLAECDDKLGAENCYLIGESVMYKEMKDGFQRELVLLTLLTVFSIFLIVALTFRSILIPAVLVMTVLTGVNINVFVSGLGGSTMLYLAYLIVQSILIGATIDYGILFTNYYLGFRREGLEISYALQKAYRGSIHTIMTSGLIIILAPFIMSKLLTDPTICSILSSLTFGALSVILLIILILPALLAALDRLITRRS